MEHVRERCVLLRACWRVAPSPRLQTAFAIPAHVKHKEGTHTTALAPQDGGAQDAAAEAARREIGAAAAPLRTPQACPHLSIGLEHGGVPAPPLPAPPLPVPPLPAQYTTYARTISIVCDGQVLASSLSSLSLLSLSPLSLSSLSLLSLSPLSLLSLSPLSLSSLSPLSLSSLSPLSLLSPLSVVCVVSPLSLLPSVLCLSV
jgi:hypothetical protein